MNILVVIVFKNLYFQQKKLFCFLTNFFFQFLFFEKKINLDYLTLKQQIYKLHILVYW